MTSISPEVKAFRSQIFQESRLKNGFLTFITFGRYYRVNLRAKAEKLAGRVSSLEQLQNGIKDILKQSCPPEVKTHRQAVDHVYAQLDPELKKPYKESFVKSLIKISFTVNRQVTSYHEWKALKYTLSYLETGGSGTGNIPLAQKWLGLEAVMQRIYQMRASKNGDILSTLKQDPFFSKIYTERELKNLIRIARFYDRREMLETFKLKTEFVESSHSKFWYEYIRIPKSEAEQEQTYHLIETVALGLKGAQLSDLANLNRKFYTRLYLADTNSPLNTVAKIDYLPRLLAELKNPLPTFEDFYDKFKELYTREEIELIYKCPKKFEGLKSLTPSNAEVVWKKALEESRNEIAAVKARRESLFIEPRTIVTTEAAAVFKMSEGEYSESGMGYLAKQEQHTFTGTLDFPLDAVFVEDFKRSGTITYTDSGEAVNYTCRDPGTDEAFLSKLRELSADIDKNHSLKKNIQLSLGQDFLTYFTNFFQSEDQLVSYSDPIHEISCVRSQTGTLLSFHQKLVMSGTIREPYYYKGLQPEIGAMGFTVEFDHVKVGENWEIQNVKFTQLDAIFAKIETVDVDLIEEAGGMQGVPTIS